MNKTNRTILRAHGGPDPRASRSDVTECKRGYCRAQTLLRREFKIHEGLEILMLRKPGHTVQHFVQ